MNKHHVYSLLLAAMLAPTATMAIDVQEAKGWQESAYVKFTLDSGATGYNVYVKGGNYADYTQIDQQLVRNYGTYGRADIVGLKAGTYTLKVVPVANKTEQTGKAIETQALTVTNYDRTGYAHFNRTAGVGAYNNDGTLKAGAVVLYVTNNNINTISYYVNDGSKAQTPQVGLGNILKAFEKGKETRPFAIRFVGEIKSATTDATQLQGEAGCLNLKAKNYGDELNVTFEGIGDDATLNGIGIRFNRAGSVEVRNIGILNHADDCFEITQCQRMWLHNIDLFYGNAGSDADQAKGDGSTDIKKGSTYTTFAYIHYWDSGKASLCGLSGESTEDVVTYHHNWFDHSDSRHPRVRTKTVHVYNNYYDGVAKYGVGAALGSSIFVEANYFRNTKEPMMISLQGNDVYAGTSKRNPNDNGTFSGENGGMIKAYANKIIDTNSTTCYWPYSATSLLTKGKYVTASSLGVDTSTDFDCYEATSRNETVPATIKSYSGGNTYNNFDTDPAKIYTYTPDAADDVPTIVKGEYGAGRMNHGDITWTFSDADDKNYSVDSKLKTMLSSYKTTLVGIFGDENASSGETGGDQPGGDDNPGQTTGDTTLCHFESGAPSCSLVKVNGNYSDSKGSITHDGTTYTHCVKMESSTSITITPTFDCTVTLFFDAVGKNFKLDGTKIKTDANGKYAFEATTGTTYTLTKGDSMNLFLITFTQKVTEGISTLNVNTQKQVPIYDLAGQRIQTPHKGKIYIMNGKKHICR